MLLLVALMSNPSFAAAPHGGGAQVKNQHSQDDLTWAELDDTAYTINRGVVLHPLTRSTFGIMKHLDAKASIPGWILGPRLAVEYSPIESKMLALSIEPEATSLWGFKNWDAGATLHASVGTGRRRDHGKINASAGFFDGHRYTLDNTSTSQDETTNEMYQMIPIDLGYDVYTGSSRSVIRVDAGTDVAMAMATDAPNATFEANFNHSTGDNFRYSLGVGAAYGENPFAGVKAVPAVIQNVKFLPYPTVELWWRL